MICKILYKNNSFFGTVQNKNHILSCAHPFSIFGSYKIDKKEFTILYMGNKYTIKNIKFDPKSNIKRYVRDFVIIELNEIIEDFITIPLKEYENNENSQLYVLFDDKSKILMEYIPEDISKKIFKHLFKDCMIACKTLDNQIKIKPGHSGAPLIQNINGDEYQIGIVSWNKPNDRINNVFYKINLNDF